MNVKEDCEYFAIDSADTIYGSCWEGYYASEDSGDNWTQTSTLHGYMFRKPIVVTSDGHLYSSIAGVWKSEDGGYNWTQIPTEVFVHYTIMESRIFVGSDDRVYATSGSVYALVEEKATSVDDVPLESHPNPLFATNYPNPFRHTTIITFQISMPEHVQIEILDILGRRVKILLDQLVNPGQHEVRLDGAGMTPGTYYARIRSLTHADIHKMVLLD
jgi:hypothetical protein